MRRYLQSNIELRKVEPMSRAEVARVMGSSDERVRQIELEALDKLRRVLERRGIAEEDLLDSVITGKRPLGYDMAS